MKKQILFLLFTLLLTTVQATEYSSWKTYLSYNNTTAIAEGRIKVLAVANGSLYGYDKEDQSITFYSKENGLNDNDISFVKYNAAASCFILCYSDGNIDLMDENNNITNLPYLKDNTAVQDKSINNVNIDQGYAYLSTNFGVVTVNMNKKEIADTYKLGVVVNSVCLNGSSIYAATANGLMQANTSDNLLDSNNWSSMDVQYDTLDKSSIRQLGYFNNCLCMFAEKSGIYYRKEDSSLASLLSNTQLNGMTLQNGKLITYTSNQAYIYSSLNARITLKADTINDLSSLNDENTYWIATGYSGIKCLQKSNDTYQITVSDLLDYSSSPKRNFDAFMTWSQNKLWIAGGGRWINRYYYPVTMMIYDGKTWNNINENRIASAAGLSLNDATSIAVDPNDATHYFASTWGEGVLEMKDDQLVKLHSLSNSTLKSAVSGSSASHYVRVEGLTYDKDHNLWMTNTAKNGDGGINVYTSDSTWICFSDGDYYSLKNQELIDKIVISDNGDKWVNIARGSNAGLFVFNDNGTLNDTSDDKTQLYTTLHNSGGSSLAITTIYCMAKDKNGEIWLGTNNGLVVCSNPNDALTTGAYFTRITRSDTDNNLSYFLNGEVVTSIAVDGGNRKWIGTQSSGLILISADGNETVETYTTSNSPLLSNNIYSLAINDNTGEVYAGTAKGLVSYMSGATSGKESFSDVYAYPNPVRPEHENKVTITGLMDNSNIKITDINGNLIYQTTSLGGQAIWNCCTRKGERVATGIYLVMAATEDSSESVVTKIMVIK